MRIHFKNKKFNQENKWLGWDSLNPLAVDSFLPVDSLKGLPHLKGLYLRLPWFSSPILRDIKQVLQTLESTLSSLYLHHYSHPTHTPLDLNELAGSSIHLCVIRSACKVERQKLPDEQKQEVIKAQKLVLLHELVDPAFFDLSVITHLVLSNRNFETFKRHLIKCTQLTTLTLAVPHSYLRHGRLPPSLKTVYTAQPPLRSTSHDFPTPAYACERLPFAALAGSPFIYTPTQRLEIQRQEAALLLAEEEVRMEPWTPCLSEQLMLDCTYFP